MVTILDIRLTENDTGILAFFDLRIDRVTIRNFTFVRGPKRCFIFKPLQNLRRKKQYAVVDFPKDINKEIKQAFAIECKRLGYDKKWSRKDKK